MPTLLMCCMNHVCYDCAEKHRISKIDELKRNEKKIKCMFCNGKFHCIKDTPWKVNNHFIEESGIDVDLTVVRETQASMLATATTNNRANRRSSATSSNRNVADEGNSNNASAAVRPNEQEDTEGGGNNEAEIIDLVRNDNGDSASSPIAFSNHDSGTTLRRSRRLSLRNTAVASDENQSQRNQMITSTRQSKRLKTEGTDAADDIIETNINRSTDNIEVDPRMKSDVHQQRAESTASNNEAEDRRWNDALSIPDLDVYRIRCYNNVRTLVDDKFSRRISEWCVNNGIMITELEIAKILPRNQWFDGEALRMKNASMDGKELREVCNKCKNIDPEEKPYIGSYKQFIEMKKGSILVLHTKGGYSKRDPPQTLTFGIVEDDKLATMTTEEAVRRNCPLDLSDSHSPVKKTGFMVKKVKWLRQGELHSVRGPRQVNWLVEASPFWLNKVGTKDENIVRTAVRKMSSEQFMSNTHYIDNQWTMG